MSMERKRLSMLLLLEATVVGLCPGCDTIKSWDREERDRDLRHLYQGTADHQVPPDCSRHAMHDAIDCVSARDATSSHL